MSRTDATFVGSIQSVSGGILSIELRDDLVSSMVLVEGESYRVGQIGAFYRIPLGYNQLFAVCTQVGANAVPQSRLEEAPSNRWISATLFGEALSGKFERGVSNFPTVGDEVHLVTTDDLGVIYGFAESGSSVSLGRIAASSGIEAKINLDRLVSRHVAIVGSTGSGKSNLATVLLEAVSAEEFPSSRVLVIDPHGEYASALPDRSTVFKVYPTIDTDQQLYVPFWALPFDEFLSITMGSLSDNQETIVRDEISIRRTQAAAHLDLPPPIEAVTADSPIPFSAKKLWFDLDDFERRTYATNERTTTSNLTNEGSIEELVSNIYPPPAPGGNPPFTGTPRGMGRQLSAFRSRLRDARYDFLFSPGEFTPDESGGAQSDLDSLVATWVGGEKPVSILDVSGLPTDVLGTVVGTLVRIVYDTLFWANDLPVSGRKQPLLILLEEAHLFLPVNETSAAHRIITRIAKEGRKYGIGIAVVTQRPTEVEQTILSQCGTMVSLRLSNSGDRGVVASMMPDDLGNLAALLPALRTGEGLVVGEAMPVPSRVIFDRARSKSQGDDPQVSERWRLASPDSDESYSQAIKNWRAQRLTDHDPTEGEDNA